MHCPSHNSSPMFRGDTSQSRRVEIYNHSIKSGLVNAKDPNFMTCDKSDVYI